MKLPQSYMIVTTMSLDDTIPREYNNSIMAEIMRICPAIEAHKGIHSYNMMEQGYCAIDRSYLDSLSQTVLGSLARSIYQVVIPSSLLLRVPTENGDKWLTNIVAHMEYDDLIRCSIYYRFKEPGPGMDNGEFLHAGDIVPGFMKLWVVRYVQYPCNMGCFWYDVEAGANTEILQNIVRVTFKTPVAIRYNFKLRINGQLSYTDLPMSDVVTDILTLPTVRLIPVQRYRALSKLSDFERRYLSLMFRSHPQRVEAYSVELQEHYGSLNLILRAAYLLRRLAASPRCTQITLQKLIMYGLVRYDVALLKHYIKGGQWAKATTFAGGFGYDGDVLPCIISMDRLGDVDDTLVQTLYSKMRDSKKRALVRDRLGPRRKILDGLVTKSSSLRKCWQPIATKTVPPGTMFQFIS